MNRPLGLIALAAIVAALAIGAPPAYAQAPAPKNSAASQSQLQTSAQKLFKAIADGNLAEVKAMTVAHDARRMTGAKLSIPAVGPKIHPIYAGKVLVLRQNSRSAVVEADFYAPDSTDTPPSEIKHLRIYLVKQGADWKAAAPDRKQAGAEPFGGWYHPGSFTFCPNKGMVFLPNHFSAKLKDSETAVCR